MGMIESAEMNRDAMDTDDPRNILRPIHLAAFPELNPNPIIERDSSGTTTYVNSAAKQIFPDIQQTGKAHPYLIDIGIIESELRQKEIKLHVREIEIDGVWYQQSIYIVPGVGLVSIFGVDITALKQAEESLVDSRNRLKAILESSLDAVILIDGEGIISYLNPRAERTFGYTRDEAIGRKLHEFLVSN
jgi:hypothetical protein